MRFLERVPYKQVYEAKQTRIFCHYEYCDHPLDGLIIHNSRLVYFTWEYGADFVYLFKLSIVEKIGFLTRTFLFAICVGRHCIYSEGKRKYWYHRRRPYWLHDLLFTQYYKRSNHNYSKIRKIIKQQCGIDYVRDCESNNICKFCETDKLVRKVSEPYRQLDFPRGRLDE